MSPEADAGPQHDFDFWIGEWDVFGPQGRQIGSNSITALFPSGAIAEHWRGNGEVVGYSLNAYDALRGCWHQTWVDSGGGLLLLDGGLRDGSMELEGTGPGQQDESVAERQRITWTPRDGEVRQLWEVSADDGATWTVAFDGRYRRAQV